MNTLREAAEEALRWMEHARLHLTIKERMHPDGLGLYDSATEALRAALAQPKTELRDQHKAFTHWYFGLRGINEANFNPEYLAWAAWKAALAAPENRPCTCHPDDNPPQPCAQRYALTECKALAQPETAEPVAWAVMCDGTAVQTFLTETAANLIAENRREQTRGRDFDWQTIPLYAHPPRDEWRPASEPPTGGMRRVLVWHKQGGFNGTLYSPGHWDEHWPLGTITHWRDVQPPTEGSK